LGKLQLWNILTTISVPQEKEFTSKIFRPELTAAAVCSLLSAFSSLSFLIRDVCQSWIEPPNDEISKLLNLCLSRGEDSVVRLVPSAVEKVALLNSEGKRGEMARNWIVALENISSYAISKGPGYTIAIGAIFATLTDSNENGTKDKILDTLALRCTSKVKVEDRTVALQSLRLLFEDVAKCSADTKVRRTKVISRAVLTALNDYTINERGDVGSLVRIEALTTLEEAWGRGLLSASEDESKLHAAAVRLSVEKLDKVRAKAAHCLEVSDKEHFERAAIGITTGVSSYAYFFETLKLLGNASSEELRVAVLEGYISSAGMGSETVVKASRLALVDTLDSVAQSSPSAAMDGRESPCRSLLEIVNALTAILSSNLDTDRVLLPALEVLAFLFDARIMQRLIDTDYKWRNLLSLVQKSHYKTNNMQKLHLALEVYRGFAEVEVGAIRDLVIRKVSSMLAHPFPKVRDFSANLSYTYRNRFAWGWRRLCL
jgi:tubulin-specific chaperone D